MNCKKLRIELLSFSALRESCLAIQGMHRSLIALIWQSFGKLPMKKLKLNAYSILSALRKPEAVGNSPIVIAAGKLSDIIKIALKVSNSDYYGLTIKHDGGVLSERDIRAIHVGTELRR